MARWIDNTGPINGIIPLVQAINEDNYYIDCRRGLPDNWWGRIAALPFRFLLDHQIAVMKIDAKVFRVKEGDIFPKYSFSYWWGKPLMWLCKNGYEVKNDQR